MRWKKEVYSRGDKRIIKKFAYFPVYIHDIQGHASSGEWRWLETVKIEQEYYRGYADSGWDNIRFVD